jgi:hypothetical protein
MPLHVDQLSGSLDLIQIGRPRLHLGGLTGKRRTAAAVGSDVDDGGATVIFRGGEVDERVRVLAAVTMACSESSPSSRNSSHGRMVTKISDDTPTINYRRTGGL